MSDIHSRPSRPSRRGVLKAAALTSAGGVLAGGGAGLAQAATGRGFQLAVFDERYDDGRAFGREMAARGVAVHAMRGDPTRLWYDDLHHRWAERPSAIAGLTEAGALTGLEMMAAAAGLRLALRADLRRDPDRSLVCRVEAPQDVLAAMEPLPLNSGWGVSAARLVAACPAVWSARASGRAATGGRLERAHEATSLVAWVLAPAVRA